MILAIFNNVIKTQKWTKFLGSTNLFVEILHKRYSKKIICINLLIFVKSHNYLFKKYIQSYLYLFQIILFRFIVKQINNYTKYF